MRTARRPLSDPLPSRVRRRSRLAHAALALACTTGLLGGCATPSAGGRPTAGSRAPDSGALAGDGARGIGSALATLLYAPVKFNYAVAGSVVGGLVWVLTAGDTEATRRVLVPAVTGDYVVTSEHLRNPETIHFVGGPVGASNGWSPATPVASTTRDVSDLPSYGASLPAVSAAASRECGERLPRPVVRFESDRAALTDASKSTLDALVRTLTACPSLQVAIEAHSDSRGSAAANLSLSERRAQTVADYLIGRGIEAHRLDPIGYGEERPLASNLLENGRAQNRRVELSLR